MVQAGEEAQALSATPAEWQPSEAKTEEGRAREDKGVR